MRYVKAGERYVRPFKVAISCFTPDIEQPAMKWQTAGVARPWRQESQILTIYKMQIFLEGAFWIYFFSQNHSYDKFLKNFFHTPVGILKQAYALCVILQSTTFDRGAINRCVQLTEDWGEDAINRSTRNWQRNKQMNRWILDCLVAGYAASTILRSCRNR